MGLVKGGGWVGSTEKVCLPPELLYMNGDIPSGRLALTIVHQAQGGTGHHPRPLEHLGVGREEALKDLGQIRPAHLGT